ncbi:MAG: hypothetical protein U0R50_03395 [Gaiellales bacterium]
MTSHVGRIYVAALSVLLFFVLWASLAAHPWVSAAPDPRLAALDAKQRLLGTQLARAQADLADRWATYRAAEARRRALTAAPAPTPVVRVVQLPPLATTRTS